MLQALEEFVPVGQVHYVLLRLGQDFELFQPAVRADEPGSEVFASQDRVNGLETSAAERQSDGRPQQLVGARVYERVFGRGPGDCRVDTGACELFELTTSLLTVYGHQCQDEVSL